MKGSVPHLVWRDGRPRWVPSPSLRRRDWKGKDLRNPDGTWMCLDDAIAAAKAINTEAARQRPKPIYNGPRRLTGHEPEAYHDTTERVGRHLIRNSDEFLGLLARGNILFRRRKLPTAGSYIYVFEFDGRWAKIGYTTNPTKRLAHHAVHVPVLLVPRLLTPGGIGDERRLHRIFAPFRERGEWYRLDGEFAQWLAGINVQAEMEGAIKSHEK